MVIQGLKTVPIFPNKANQINLQKVAYVLGFHTNILSAQHMKEAGYT
jgi:hypothetical protein